MYVEKHSHRGTRPARYVGLCPACGYLTLDWIRFDSDLLAWVCEGC